MVQVKGISAPASSRNRRAAATSTRSSSCSPTCRVGSSASASPATSGASTCTPAADAIHACNYLLAVDVDMTALPGYRFANWDQGYGDFALRPTSPRSARIPWLETHRARAVRPRRRGDRRTDRGVAPPHPAAPGRAGRGAGLHGDDRVGARVLPVQGLVRRGRGARATATSRRTRT